MDDEDSEENIRGHNLPMRVYGAFVPDDGICRFRCGVDIKLWLSECAVLRLSGSGSE